MSSSISNSRRGLCALAVAFTAALVACVLLSEWLVRVQVAPIDTMTNHQRRLAEVPSGYVAFGDSHMARGFDAHTPFVNLAYPSENIRQTAWKAARYLLRMPAPRQVILQADPHLFADYRLKAGLGDYPERFGEAAGHELIQALSDYHRPKIAAYWRAFLLGGGRLTSRIEQTGQGALLSPGDFARVAPAARAQEIALRMALHRPLENFRQRPEAALFTEMVESFLSSGAQLCLVRLPLSPDYRRALAAAAPAERARWDAVNAFYRGFADRPGVRYVDHSAYFNELSLFRDSDHLNKQGALEYGEKLVEACFGGPPLAPRDEPLRSAHPADIEPPPTRPAG